MIILSEMQVLERMSFELVFKAVEQALIAAADGSGFVNPVIISHGLKEGQTFSIKSGGARLGPIVGLKVGSFWPENLAAGLAPHGSSIFLLDPNTGRLMAVVEANQLNGPRTAAADAVAACALARINSETLTLVGAGHQAVYEARALCAVRPIKRVLITSRTAARSEVLRSKIAAELSVDVEVTGIERACREADILVTITPSRVPLFDSKWLRPGVHVATMGSDQKGKQELPLDLLRRAQLFCDLPSQSISIGEFQHVRTDVESGSIALTAIGDVLAKRAQGRRADDEITVFDSSGLALQDLFVAVSILQAGK